MSKKRFSEGLDDLFSDSKSSVGSLFGNDVAVAPQATGRRSGQKSFMSDLDSLIQESMDESFEKLEASRSDDSIPSNKSKSSVRDTASGISQGLDSLIRQTIDIKEVGIDEASGKRRLTVAIDKEKVEKLKAIARLENSYMKDLLVALIDEYISEYTRENGEK